MSIWWKHFHQEKNAQWGRSCDLSANRFSRSNDFHIIIFSWLTISTENFNHYLADSTERFDYNFFILALYLLLFIFL